MGIVIELILRMILSVAAGFAVGFERKMRFKEAGIRTHTIVCVGSCLFMIVSKYGFESADQSRVAAQIVSGIGFIGAGMIFYHKEMIRGLTTAAGIWATAAIGMAAGAGMYIVCSIATMFIILIQCIMHLKFKVFHSKHFLKLNIIFKFVEENTNKRILDIFNVEKFEKFAVKKENDETLCNAVIVTDKVISADEICNIIKNNSYILTIDSKNSDF